MCLKPKLKCSDGFFNLFINNKEIKTPEKVSCNFKEKIFPNLILKEIKRFKLKNLNQSIYYNIFSLKLNNAFSGVLISLLLIINLKKPSEHFNLGFKHIFIN